MEKKSDQYDPLKWKSYDDFYLYDTDQREPDWKEVRKGRPSGSNCSACIGRSHFSTPDQTALEISGKIEKKFTQEQLDNMNHGTKYESVARDWYCTSRNVKVKEIGFVVPKWNKSIGVSIDGEVENTDKIIEIKCPKKMYELLKIYMKNQDKGLVKINDHSHIFDSHYDQMQLGMIITGKRQCDYIVFCVPENNVFVQTINFDQKHWDFMYEKLKIFIKEKLDPLLVGTPYPLMPPI